MRLLFATGHTYLRDRVGGSESSIHEQCLALARRGVHVAVLARAAVDGAPRAAARWRDRLLGRSPLRDDRSLGYPVFRCQEPEHAAGDVVRDFRPDAAVVQTGRPMGLAAALLESGVPTLVHLRDVQYEDLGGRVAAASGLAFLANSRFTANRARESLGVTPRVVPPVVLPERYRTEGMGRRVLFVNPVPVKGWSVARDLAKARPDVGFDFVEAWPVFGRMRARWRDELGEASNVTWHAPVLDMRPLYARARLVLVPSLATPGVWEEGWGRVVTEAHCSGIPVLASRSGGLPEAVGPGGLLVDADAPPDAWAESFGRIFDDPAEHAKLSADARGWAARPEIRPDQVIDALLEAIAQVR